ncbi:MAG: hemerythrin domain-containing protein [Planctomycetota bacterium]|nr:hemerythrin domain-containing protein [Planctomycetota bacterium]
MIGSRDEFFAYANYLEAEHRRLQRIVRSAQDAFAGSLELAESQLSTQRHALIDCLTDLHQQLDQHFEQEEQGGCIEEAVSHRPALASRAKSLEAEHAQLLDGLDQLIRCLGRHVSGQDWVEVVRRFDQFADTLRAHEAVESDILQRGFNLNLENA